MTRAPAPDIEAYAERFPLRTMSVSSLSAYLRCPERWRRRYIEGEFEPASGNMVAGGAFGAAEGQNFAHKIESGRDLAVDDVLDVFSDEWNDRVERDTDRAGIDWGEEKPGEVKDSAAHALRSYHRLVTPQLRPLSVEREFELRFDGMPWTFHGYLDLEVRAAPRRRKGAVVADLKLKKKRMRVDEAAADLQVSTYLAGRRAEGDPAPRFDFHVATRAREPAVELVPAYRTDEQLDSFLGRVFYTAGEIAWRLEYDAWGYAPPGAWWCGAKWCGFWGSCPAGGLAAAKSAEAVRLA